ncbi:hypothetical protein EC991_005141 [Linnemannia zychae]|nr:hypothetical protein EC991_005141 [Linnemannia zychae]
MVLTYKCFACETHTFTSKEELIKHITGYHNIPLSNDIFKEPQEQINHDSADVAMEVDSETTGSVQYLNVLEGYEVHDERDVENSAPEDDETSYLNDGESVPAIKPSVNFAPMNDMSIVKGIAYTVCVVHAANYNKNIPEFIQENDLLFPLGSTLVNGVPKHGRNRAQPTAWIDRNSENGGAVYTPLTEAQRNDYSIIASHRFRLNSPYPNTVCSAKRCQETITWRSAGVVKRQAKLGSTITAAYLKNVKTCFECRSMSVKGGQA